MLGLDAAGKTTILYKLHIGEVLSTVPTIGEERDAVQQPMGCEATSSGKVSPNGTFFFRDMRFQPCSTRATRLQDRTADTDVALFLQDST